MKNFSTYSIAFLSILLIAACNPTEEKVGKDLLADLQSERDSLQLINQEVSTKIFDLEKQINAEKERLGIAKVFPVKTVKLERDTFEHYIKVQGGISADKSIVINAESAGTVRNIYIKEGDKVNAGQTLVALDTYVLDNQLKELETAYALAETVFKKQEKLWNQNIGSEIEFLQAKNRKESLETQMATLKSQKAKSIIKAPFSGTIDAILPKQGEAIAPGVPVVRLINISNVKIEAEISERYVGSIGKGSKMKVKIPQRNESLTLNLDYVGSYINPANRTYRVFARIDNKDGSFLPNMVSDIALRDYVNTDAVTVPNKAILEDLNGGFYVYVVSKKGDINKVEQRNIKIGKSTDGTTEVSEGLSGNEVVITDGAKSVNPGDVVSLMK